jgi:tRNA (guanine6-N2)-methyltransferase
MSPRLHGGAYPADDLSRSPASSTIEILVPRGIEDVAEREITSQLSHRVGGMRIGHGTIVLNYLGALPALLHLRTVTSVYLVLHFDVARPRGLLGDENLRRLLREIGRIREMWPPRAYKTLHLSAAGGQSPVMRRLVDAMEHRTGLREDPREGNLQIRVRRGNPGNGWDVLVRISPRPLSARPWRVCDMPGALNAAVAAAMVLLTEPRGKQSFLNPACGSGTLLVERAASEQAQRIIGCDIAEAALSCAQENISASGYGAAIEIYGWDAQDLPLDQSSVDAICIDLPFGHLVGTHEANHELYPRILRECARVARTGAMCCVLTHQADLLDDIVRQLGLWAVQRRTRVHVGGLVPTLFLLRRGRS